MSTIYTTVPNFPASEGRSGETFYNNTTSWFMSNQQPAPGFRALSPFNVESVDGTINTRITARAEGGTAISEIQLISSGTKIGEFNILDIDGANVEFAGNLIQKWVAGPAGDDPNTTIYGRTQIQKGVNTALVIDQEVLPVLGTTTTMRVGTSGSNNISMRPTVTLIEESTLFNPSGITIRDGTAGANPTNLLTLTPNLIQQSQFGQTILNIGTDSFPNARGFIAHPQGSSRNISIGNNSTIIHESTIFTPGNGMRVVDGDPASNRFATVLPSTITFNALGGPPIAALECTAGLNKWATLFGNDYIYLETQAFGGVGRNRAVDFNGLIPTGGGAYGQETHNWNANFVRPVNITTLSTTTASITNAQITNINGVAAGTGGLIPTGSLLPWAPAVYTTTTPPAGYLFCDGTVYPIGSFPALAALMGTTYGGSAGVTFAVPDMRFGRAIIGGAVNNATFQVTNVQPGVPYSQVLGLNNATSVSVGGVEYGTTNRAMYIKPNPTTGFVYSGPGLRAGYSFFLNSGSGQTYTIIDTLSAPFGNNAYGPTYMLFLLDVPMNGTDVAAISQTTTFITVIPGVGPGIDPTTDTRYLPAVKAGSKNDYLNYTQRPTEVGAIQYTVFRGGVRGQNGAGDYMGEPNVGYNSQYLNGLGSYQDYNNNPLRSPVGSSIPSAYSYAMGYIIKT